MYWTSGGVTKGAAVVLVNGDVVLRCGVVVGVVVFPAIEVPRRIADASKGLPGAKTEATHNVRHKVSQKNPTRPVLTKPTWERIES